MLRSLKDTMLMLTKLRIIGCVVATLALPGAALAQQAGGGGGGGGQGGDAGGSDNSIMELRLQDHERAQAKRMRAANNGCTPGAACKERPRPAQPIIENADDCGGEFRTVRDRSGHVIRRVCHFNG